MIFIVGPASAWVVLLALGLFRHAPFPVVYALLIDSLLVDSVSKAAGTAMGIMIGVALGLSGCSRRWWPGPSSTRYGFTTHYIVLATIVLLGLLPLSWTRETVSARQRAGEEVAR